MAYKAKYPVNCINTYLMNKKLRRGHSNVNVLNVTKLYTYKR